MKDKELTTTGGAALVPVESEMQRVGGMIQTALEKGMDAEGIKALTETYVQMADRDARREFNAAFARFKAECPQPRKTKKAHHSMYTPLDELERVCGPHLEANGFSYWWDSGVVNNMMEVTCHLEHDAGHSKSSTYTCPFSKIAKMSEEDKFSSAHTRARRYSFISILGVTSTDEEGGHDLSKLNDEQAANIEALLDELPTGVRPRFFKWASVTKTADMLQEQYSSAVKNLEEKRRRL